MECGPGTIYAGVPSFLGFRVGGPSHSNFLASTVGLKVQSIRGFRRIFSGSDEVHAGRMGFTKRSDLRYLVHIGLSILGT